MRSFVAVVVAGLIVTGCASRADPVEPLAVSAVQFSHLTCREGLAQLATLREREATLSRAENNAGELARARGEVIALTEASQITCAHEAGVTFLRMIAPPGAIPEPAPG